MYTGYQISINNYPKSLQNKVIKQISDEQTILNLEEDQQHQQNTLQTKDEEKMTLPYVDKKGEPISREVHGCLKRYTVKTIIFFL